MVKQGVHQGEIIIDKLDQAIVGIERLEKVLGTGGGGGGGGNGGDGGGGGGGDRAAVVAEMELMQSGISIIHFSDAEWDCLS